MSRAPPPTKTAILINDTSTKAHLGCRLVVARIVAEAAAAGVRVVATASVHTDWRRHEELLALMRRASVVLVNGEGTLHHATAQARSLAAAGPFCRAAGVPVVLLNSVYQENDAAIAEDCRSFDRIFLRESRSAEAARAAGLRADIIPDLTLGSDVMAPFGSARRNRTILITDNANKTAGAAAIDAGCRRRDAGFLHLATREPVNPFLDPSLCPERVFLDAGPVAVPPPPKRPRKLIRKTLRAGWQEGLHLRRMRAFHDLRVHRPAAELLRRIATCRALVAGRFHSACMALLAGTPFAALSSNTAKMEGMLADAGLPRLLASGPEAAFDLALAWTDADRAAAARYVERARRETRAMFADIADLAR